MQVSSEGILDTIIYKDFKSHALHLFSRILSLRAKGESILDNGEAQMLDIVVLAFDTLL